MSYVKTIVCLAASWKYQGVCVAGKELTSSGGIAGWIRPVGDREKGALTDQECAVSSGRPQLMQTIEVTLQGAVPDDYQVENHLISAGKRWLATGRFPTKRLDDLLDDPRLLWLNGKRSSRGVNDAVPEAFAREHLRSSLYLIQPETLNVSVGTESSMYGTKVKVRASFRYRGVSYRLGVTDPVAAAAYKGQGEGNYEEDATEHALCISLAEPLPSGICYKLVAGIVRRT